MAGGSEPAEADRATAKPPLNDTERRQFDLVRRFGTLGALLLACGSLGAGAAPVFNPVPDMPVIGLFARLPSVAIACSYTGLFAILVAWLWLGRFTRPDKPRLATTRQLNRVMLLWTAPLVFIPPMFSRDVYSYLAQSKIFLLGMNPYEVGPAPGLGTADLLARNVPNVWRETPAPYGPAFLAAGRAITSLVGGDHVISAALLHRFLELIGVALFVWALPRLARRFGVQPVSALWLGALNPLVLFHLIAGAHNEALMIGFMLAGIEVALTKMPPVPLPGEPVAPITRAELGYFLGGALLVSVGAAIKFTALVGLGFLGVHAARRLGGTWRRLIQVGVVSMLVSGVVLAGFSMIGGLGFGWFSAALSTPGQIKTFLAPMTDIGNVTGQIGIALGFGDNTDAAIDLLRQFGMVASVLIAAAVLLLSFYGKVRPLTGIALAFGAIVFFGASVQPWYLLWAMIPLAAGIAAPRFRIWVALIVTAATLVSPMPTGSSPTGGGFVVPESIVLALIVLAVLLLLVRNRIPVLGFSLWRKRSLTPRD